MAEPQGSTEAAANGNDPAAGDPPALRAPILEPKPAEEPSSAPEPAIEEPTATEPERQEAAAQPAPEPAPQAAPEPPPEPPQAAPVLENETLPVALEPELRKIIDTAVARVASIELAAIRESRTITQRSEEEGREALKYALDRAFQLVNSFELLTVTVAGMVSALRVELDAAMMALHQVDDPYSHLASPPAAPAKAIEGASQPEPDQPPAAQEVQANPTPDPVTDPVQGMNGDGPELITEPSPEMTEMFREQIINMKQSGKSREEAERSLLRFNLGRRFIGLLDEIYSDESSEDVPAPASPQRKRFARRFFSRH